MKKSNKNYRQRNHNRLTGFENTLLGFSSRIHPLVKSILPGTPAAVDTICFGITCFPSSFYYDYLLFLNWELDFVGQLG